MVASEMGYLELFIGNPSQNYTDRASPVT